MDHGGIKSPNRDPLWFFSTAGKGRVTQPGGHWFGTGKGSARLEHILAAKSGASLFPSRATATRRHAFGLRHIFGVTAEMWKLVLLEERRRSGEPYDVESPDAFGRLWGKDITP